MSENKESGWKLPPVGQAILSIAIGLFCLYYGYKAYVDLSHFNEYGGEIVMPRFMFFLNEVIGALGTGIAFALVGLYFFFHAGKVLLGANDKAVEENNPQ
ncbi:MAG: hypothetical protein SOW66_01990 [Porphyromonas sp.]|nr:hypothetical protein [Porphyromonas sp.]MDY5858538.1 hypothetical protein [Porphyromonas sp.]